MLLRLRNTVFVFVFVFFFCFVFFLGGGGGGTPGENNLLVYATVFQRDSAETTK